jgi:hypothetical protein
MVGMRNDPGKTVDSVNVQFQLPPCILSADLTSTHGTVNILSNKVLNKQQYLCLFFYLLLKPLSLKSDETLCSVFTLWFEAFFTSCSIRHALGPLVGSQRIKPLQCLGH